MRRRHLSKCDVFFKHSIFNWIQRRKFLSKSHSKAGKIGRAAARKGKLGKNKKREKEKKEQCGGRSGTLPVF